jgi:N-acetylmuramoyl-L-alanine amidase
MMARGLIAWLALALALPALGAPALAEPARIQALEIAREGEGVVARISVSRAPEGGLRALALTAPDRLALDIAGASAARREAPGAGRVKAARVAQFDPETVRLVFDLDAPMAIAAASLADAGTLEVRLKPVAPAAFAALARRGRQAIALAPAAGVAPLPEAPSQRELDEVERLLATEDRQRAQEAARRPKRARPLVVIDAGHGGKDVGAISVHGRFEKDFTLAVALAARRAIERKGGVEVRLTRSDDRFLSLAERVRIAREAGADLFLSIHADSAPNREARGASVYTLSEVASDREAARLARRENRADMIAGADFSDQESDIVPILVDLGRRDSMNASAEFAQSLQARMAARGIGFRSQFHRFAGFQVLRNLGVPAVLLESGYLSNEEDSRLLFEARTQQAIADGIAEAVTAWLLR